MPNWSQFSGGVDRLLLVGLTWLASKGYITTEDVANYAALIVGIAGAVYAFYVNRNTNLVKQAASVPETIVVTNAETANAAKRDNVLPGSSVKVGVK